MSKTQRALCMIQSAESGEIYVSDGTRACGPVDHSMKDHPPGDFHLEIEAPDRVASRGGKILRAGGCSNE